MSANSSDMDISTALVCDQADCPITTEGRCLEGFPEGKGCPHLQTESPVEKVPDDLEVINDQLVEADDTAIAASDEEYVDLLGGEPLTVTESNEIAAERSAHVILLAGEFASGKTTLIVELYSRFLVGPFQNWMFGGSKTLFALDKLHFPTRYASGRNTAKTDRTQPENEGLLHLRMARDHRDLTFFFTDLRGERFDNVTHGSPVPDEVPFVGRADRAMVLVDGAKIADITMRQETIHRARLLIGGLTEPGGISPGRPLALVLTKLDLLAEADIAWWEEQAVTLVTFAAERGVDPSSLNIAARPADSPDDPIGLEDVLSWLTEDAPVEESVPQPVFSTGDRFFWRLPT